MVGSRYEVYIRTLSFRPESNGLHFGCVIVNAYIYKIASVAISKLRAR